VTGFGGFDFDEAEFERLIRKADGSFEALVGEVVSEIRSGLAKDSGAGAASVHAEFYTSARGLPAAQIGPDAEHEYVINNEFGTEGRAPRPIMRPAAAKRRDI